MIIDAHIHLSPPDLVADRTPYLNGEIGLSILYGDPKAPLTSTATLLADMDAAQVDKALVMGFPWTIEDNAKRHNDWLLAECQKYPTRLYPLAAFDPRSPWAYGHAESFLAAGGFGLGELCVYDEGLTPALLDNLAALGQLCLKRGSPMLVHVNEPIGHQYPGKAPMEISQIYELTRRCQGVKLILAHFGGGLPLLATIRKQVKEYLATTLFDTAAMPFLFDPKALAMAYDVIGDKFCLGTDYPLLKTARYVKYFQDAGLSEEAITGVLGGAIQKFLEL
ncbi:MAG: amidohydrolase family protein [Deltaproteobacteria bacterium]|jgi:predicted TIM-barrel fold metal-dependent hydrolase|nr:amidohydrolase family protein [Deltaproteobacteria bacterium]